MKRSKPLLILLGTLTIGLVLGFLVSGNLTDRKLEKFIRWGSEEGFKEMIYESIEPTEEQRLGIDPIIEKYAKRNGELQESWRKEHGSIMRAFREEVSPLLNAEQLEKLTMWRNHWRKHEH